MLTPPEAQKRAHQLLEEHIAACGCKTPEDVANVLMQMACMTGLAMMAIVGRADAIERMKGTVEYLTETPIQPTATLHRLVSDARH